MGREDHPLADEPLPDDGQLRRAHSFSVSSQETHGVVTLHIDSAYLNILTEMSPAQAMELGEALQTEAVLVDNDPPDSETVVAPRVNMSAAAVGGEIEVLVVSLIPAEFPPRHYFLGPVAAQTLYLLLGEALGVLGPHTPTQERDDDDDGIPLER